MCTVTKKREKTTDLVHGADDSTGAQFLSVQRETEGSLDTGSTWDNKHGNEEKNIETQCLPQGLSVTERQETNIVDLGLDESSRVKVSIPSYE